MNKLVLFLFAWLVSSPVNSQEYKLEVKKAERSYERNDFDSCSLHFANAFKLQTPTGRDLYNAASCNALNGNPDIAFDYLFAGLERGLHISKLKIDPAFEQLHKSERWTVLMKKAGQVQTDTFNKYPFPTHAAKLAKLWEEDQYFRFRLGKAYRDKDTLLANQLWIRMRAADSLVLPKLLSIIDEIGWPTRSKVGVYGASTAFLVIDHAPREIMEKYLPHLEEAAKKGEASMSQFATMKDRVLVNQGKKQIFGTQKYWDAAKGKFVLFEIEDREKVNQLRESVGLEPLTEFQ